MGNFAEGGGDGDDENDIHRHNRSVYADPVGKNKEKSCVHLQFLSVEDMAAVNLSHKELSLIKKTVKIYADERARADEARLNPYAGVHNPYTSLCIPLMHIIHPYASASALMRHGSTLTLVRCLRLQFGPPAAVAAR